MKTVQNILIGVASISIAAGTLSAENINGAGATFPAPVYSAWSYAYHKETGNKVNYQSIGSGGGIKQITERTVDFGATDDPVPPAKVSSGNFVQFPTVIGGVVAVVNIKGVAPGSMKLDANTLCKIFLGEIKTWDDASIKELNPNLNISGKITVVRRADGSGTTAIFTHYLVQTCPAWKSKIGEGKAVSWPVGLGGKGNEGVANYVKRSANSIGYVEYAYAEQNKMSYTQLKNSSGNFIQPGVASFTAAAQSASLEPAEHFYSWLTNTSGSGAWPIAGATFIVLAKDKPEASSRAFKFFDWAFTKGDVEAKRLVYIPLPENLKAKVRAYIKANGIK